MVSWAKSRRLYLEDIQFLGWSEGNTYHLGREFWMQLGMMLKEALPSTVSGQQATALADFLEGQSWENWDIHMYFWVDPDRRMLGELIQFLRCGEFEVRNEQQS